MNKKVKFIVVFVSVLISLWIIARVTNMLQFYRAPTTANYPNLKKGETFLASNLISPKRFSLVCFHIVTDTFGNETRVYRLCGLEGDKIEIKNGNLFVNNIYADSNFVLAHNYIVSKKDIEKYELEESIVEETYNNYYSEDSVMVVLPDKTILEKDIKAKRFICEKLFTDEAIKKQYATEWNADNFGPIVVPKGKYFFLGDNRLNAQDSRYIGFIDKKSCVGTVINR